MNVLIKADDAWIPNVSRSERYLAFLTVCARLDVPVSLGVVGASCVGLEPGHDGAIARTGCKIEPYTHSLNHLVGASKKEFHGTDYDYQSHSLLSSRHLIGHHFGCDVETVGFPANACDATTVELLTLHPEIKNIYYPATSYMNAELHGLPGRNIIDVNGVIELPAKNGEWYMDSGSFLRMSANARAIAEHHTLTLQIHPERHDDLSEFIRIVESLRAHGGTFVTPSML